MNNLTAIQGRHVADQIARLLRLCRKKEEPETTILMFAIKSIMEASKVHGFTYQIDEETNVVKWYRNV